MSIVRNQLTYFMFQFTRLEDIDTIKKMKDQGNFKKVELWILYSLMDNS